MRKTRVFTRILVAYFLLVSFTIHSVPIGNAAAITEKTDPVSVVQTILLENGSEIEVCVSGNSIEPISEKVIQDVINDHDLSSDCRITFYNIDYEQEKYGSGSVSTCDIFQPFPYYTYQTELTPIGSPFVMKTEFVLSVAKGQTVTLSETYQGSVNVEIETGTPYVEALIGTSITVTYEKAQQFSGPPESSQYNSRSYYIKYWGQENKWVQRQYYWGMAMGVTSGTAIIPTEYQAYSIDSYVT